MSKLVALTFDNTLISMLYSHLLGLLNASQQFKDKISVQVQALAQETSKFK